MTGVGDAKLPLVKRVHLIIADLFLPNEIAASAGLRLPALEKIFARGNRQTCPAIPFESLLCDLFGFPGGIAPVCAAFDGLGSGAWMRADPVHVRLQRDQVVVIPDVDVSSEEAAKLCRSINEHFAGQGMEFCAPHENRWYVRLDAPPDIETVPISQAAFRDMHGNLPSGIEERRWRKLHNEMQMLLHAHPVNEIREENGELPINSLWFWGNGDDAKMDPHFSHASSDEKLAEMLSSSAGILFTPWLPQWQGSAGDDELLIFTRLRHVLQRGDFSAWRETLQDFESNYAKPLWQALRQGRIAGLDLTVVGGDHLYRLSLKRKDTWAFWRSKRLLDADAWNED